jgi:WD40 repeat protein/tRNA A-37 threonylcarbamoyl transferase component Bud32
MGPLPAGTRLAGFEILSVLGQGGMGIVYKARDAKDGSLVALKTVPRELLGNPVFKKRLEREAHAAKAVSHPGIIAIRRFGEENGTFYIAFEYLPGGTLKQKLRERGRLSWKEVVALAIPLARALGAVHAAGLIHRDVKPENVLLDERGEPRLADFGLVGKTERSVLAASAALTGSRDIMGTLDYLAPEQGGGEKVDARADLYSLGATLHALLTGRPPFEGQGLALLKMHLLERPRAPGAQVSGIPEALDALVLRLLAKDPAARPQDAAAVARELEAIAAAEGRAAAPRGRLPLVAAALVLLLGLGLLAWQLTRQEPAKTAATPVTNTPVAPPAPARKSLPPECAGIEATGVTLEDAWGEYAWRSKLPITVVALSADGKVALSTGNVLAGVTVWDATTGRVTGCLEGPDAHVGHTTALALSPDGKHALTGGKDRTVKLWNLESRTVEQTFEGHENDVSGVAFLDERHFLSAGKDLAFRWWERGQPKETRNEGGAGSYVAVSPDKKHLATGEGEALLVPDSTSPIPRTVSFGAAVRCLAFSPDGASLGVGCKEDPKLRIVRTEDPRAGALECRAHGSGGVSGVAFLRDRRVVSTGFDGSLRVWTSDLRRALASGQSTEIQSLACSDEKPPRAVTGGRNGALRVWNLETGAEAYQPARGHRAYVSTITVSPDGTKVLTGSSDETLRLWDTASGQEKKILSGHHAKILTAFFTPDGKRALSGAEDGTLRLWDLAEGKEISPTESEQHDVLTRAWLSPDGSTYLWTRGRGPLELKTIDRTPIGAFAGTDDDVRAVALSADGKSFARAGQKGGLDIWSIEDRAKPVRRIETRDAVNSIRFLAKKGLVLTGGADGIVRLSNAQTGETRELPGHAQWISEAVSSPDERLVASCSSDATVRVFEVDSGRQVGSIDLSSTFDCGICIAWLGERTFLVGTARGLVLRFSLA